MYPAFWNTAPFDRHALSWSGGGFCASKLRRPPSFSTPGALQVVGPHTIGRHVQRDTYSRVMVWLGNASQPLSSVCPRPFPPTIWPNQGVFCQPFRARWDLLPLNPSPSTPHNPWGGGG